MVYSEKLLNILAFGKYEDHYTLKLEDLKVLRRSSDLLNNFKTGQGQLQLIMKHILFYHIWVLQPFWFSNLNNLTAQ